MYFIQIEILIYSCVLFHAIHWIIYFYHFLLKNVTVIVDKRHSWKWSGKTRRACLRNWKSSGVKTSDGPATRHPTIQRGCQIDLYSRVIWIQKFPNCFSSRFIARIRAVSGRPVGSTRWLGGGFVERFSRFLACASGVRAFARLKRKMTDETKPLGSHCSRSHRTVS